MCRQEGGNTAPWEVLGLAPLLSDLYINIIPKKDMFTWPDVTEKFFCVSFIS